MPPCVSSSLRIFSYTSPLFLKVITLKVAKHAKPAMTNISNNVKRPHLKRTIATKEDVLLVLVQERSFPIVTKNHKKDYPKTRNKIHRNKNCSENRESRECIICIIIGFSHLNTDLCEIIRMRSRKNRLIMI
jgi:hypothetical protein